MSEDSGMWVKVFPEYAGGTVEGSPPAPVLTNPEGGSVVAFTSGGEGDGGPTLAYGAEISPNDNGETVTIESDDPTIGGEVVVSGTTPFTDYVVKVYGVNVAGRGNAASTAAFQLNYNEATGGDVVDEYTRLSDNTRWRYHTFTTTGENDFTVDDNPKPFRILAIAGGGGGGRMQGNSSEHCYGGGGAGGMLEVDSGEIGKGDHVVTVGAGGGQYAKGEDSSIDDLFVANGGGGGPYAGDGGAGGSGGGGSGYGTANPRGGAGTPGQGHNGSGGNMGAGAHGGSGGGAGGNASGVSGGPGKESDITGTDVLYARGGGAHGGTPGTANTGNGANFNGNGASGIVVIAYQIADNSTTRQIQQAQAEVAAREAGYESGYIVGVNDGREELQEELRSMAASTLEVSE